MELTDDQVRLIANSFKRNGNGGMRPMTKVLLVFLLGLVVTMGGTVFSTLSSRVDDNAKELKVRAKNVYGGAVKIEAFEKWQTGIDEKINAVEKAIATNSIKLDAVMGDVGLILDQILPGRNGRSYIPLNR